MLASFAFEDQCAIDDSGQPNRGSHLIEHIVPAHLARVVDRQDGNTVGIGQPEWMSNLTKVALIGSLSCEIGMRESS